jgi:TPR repeat protein
VPQNDTQAIYWYTKAANSGNSDAMLSLGVASLYGKGVPKDNKAACVWFAKARSAHNAYAPDFYQRYC